MMGTVTEIKAAIERLSLSERAELERWLHGWTDDEWDRKIASDTAAGKLKRLIDEADAEIESGQLRELP